MANSLLDFTEVASRVMARLGGQVGIDEAKLAVDEVWREYMLRSWSFNKRNLALLTVAEVSGGTVNVTQGTKGVSGVGTAFLSSLAGDYFVGPDSVSYRIASIDGADGLTLELPYAGETASDQAYSIRRKDFTLEGDVFSILIIGTVDWPIVERSQGALNQIDPGRTVTGEVESFAYIDPTTSGDTRIELWPVPIASAHIPYVGMKKSALSSSTQIVTDIAPALIHGSAEQGCRNLYARTGDRRWLALSKEYQDKAALALDMCDLMDRQRFGADQGRDVSMYRGLLGRTDIDLGG